MPFMKNDTDRFPAWGPWSKKYMGTSHIVDSCRRAGVRFDLTTVPALANLDIHLPNVTLPTGWHPWDAAPTYSQYTYRVDLEWKNVVYGDVSYTELDDHAVLIRTELVNHSPLMQNLMIDHFASIEYPQPFYVDPVLPEDCIFIDALDYADYTYATARPWDRQNADGLKRGEIVEKHYTNGHGVGDRSNKWPIPQVPFGTFGTEAGDRVSYRYTLDHPMPDAVLTIRYRSAAIRYEEPGVEPAVQFVPAQEEGIFRLNDGISVCFPVSDMPAMIRVPLGDLTAGDQTLTFVSAGKGGIELDFLAIAPAASQVDIAVSEPAFVPAITEQMLPDGALVSLAYPDTQDTFYLRTFNTNTRFRRIETGSLEDAMSSRLSNPDETFDDVLEPFTRSFARKHSDAGFFHNTLVHTLYLAPGETHVEYAVISDQPVEYDTLSVYEILYQVHRPQGMGLKPSGASYELSTKLLRAAVLTNIVFPIRKDQTYILHHTPGKRWDSLYTWDSGFIGLGMLDHSPALADYILDTYTCEPGKEAYAFLHHGSPVPVQFYLFYEMLQRAADKTVLLDKYYPRMQYYYEFLIGRGSGSTTARYRSGMTSTYDYFYSSSGMDDYPAQAHMIADRLQRSAAPVISSSQAARAAKVLRACALSLGLAEDAARYDEDIDRLHAALDRWSWDPEAGYYGYVLHNDQAEPEGIYRTGDGENLNKGLDGIYPLIAGLCSEEQTRAILGHLQSPQEMLCPYGISAVDQSAGYFKVNGYWNGNVWFPHQWFIWKTMLDLGEGDFACRIAELALNVWKKEVDATHYTFEMVNVTTGRGGWFHNFGGLSTPIGLWANAYYKPGTVNVGFDTWIEETCWNEARTSLAIRLKNTSGHASLLLAAMAEGPSYTVQLDGTVVPFLERVPGTLEIRLPADGAVHRIEIF